MSFRAVDRAVHDEVSCFQCLGGLFLLYYCSWLACCFCVWIYLCACLDMKSCISYKSSHCISRSSSFLALSPYLGARIHHRHAAPHISLILPRGPALPR